ncbi:orotidine-5'-phosphate decarboxylase [Solitalea koreensis]|uniref:Orotidine-5'-phosphate decarboxylase n=1 Tax=Solitalea koreensis TaxID=543615 RepID=A0A521D953_9SPHI|nr:orotidine-5'-phosphate decarboxylase [Solitalea koreensis]SMO68247.1 orotidine-5'-phosphate decarboxylase [Solitalea koreensis]
MNRTQLFENIKVRKSFLCVGLDTDITKIPKHLLKFDNPVLEFNRQIIEATSEFCVAYKPNIAFYESNGVKGWQTLQSTMDLISSDHFTIADAKRGDIGNTSAMYARAFFKKEESGFNFDSVTVAPYMGADSVTPFLEFKNKWVILLALTSNEGSKDFQFIKDTAGEPLYEKVLKNSQNWGNADQLMFVVGATRADELTNIRRLAPDNFLLVPGVGAQGGSLQEVAKYGMNKQCGLLVNSSRAIIYASNGEDFAERAYDEAKKVQQEMSMLLDKYLS